MRKHRRKKEKVHLIFDEDERRNFLLGFRKRKEERRLKAREKLIQAMKEEKKRMKKEQKAAFQKMLLSQRTVPEIEHLLEPTTYDLPQHTVTISEVKNLDPLHSLQSKDAQGRGIKESEDVSEAPDDTGPLKDVLKKLKEHRVKAAKSSPALAASKILQKKKNKKEAKRRKRLLIQNLKSMKNKKRKKQKQST